MIESVVGPLPDGWSYITLGEACKNSGGGIQTGPFGSQLHASDYVSDGIPSIMPTNIGDNRIVEAGIARITTADAERLSKYRVRTGDIVYSRRGDVEKRALVRSREEGWLCGTGCLRVRFGEDGFDAVFASYYLGHPGVREWIARHAQGATMLNLNTKILSDVPFIRIPLEEQRAISSVLARYDDQLETLYAVIANAENIIRTLFQAWFVDFLPVRAKATGASSFRGMPQDAFDALPDGFEDSEIGEIPRGWEVGFIGDVFDLVRDKVKPQDCPDEVFEHFSIPAFDDGMRPALEAGRTIKSAKGLVREGVVLFSKLNPRIPRVWLPSALGEHRQIASTEFLICAPSDGWSRSYLYALLSQDRLQNDLASQASGTSNSHQRITPKLLEGTTIALPPSILAETFDGVAEPLTSSIVGHRGQIETLTALRDTLLPKLMTGEITAPPLPSDG